MDDRLLHELGKALHSLERDAPLLEDLLFPRQAASGENAGKPPAKKGSKLPLTVWALDVKLAVEGTLRQWSSMLREEHQLQDYPTPGSTIRAQASWIQSHLLVIDAMPWGEVCAEQIIAVARRVSDLVDPPGQDDVAGPLEVGPVKEIASWCRHLKVKVSDRSVYRWVRDEEVPSHLAPDGRLLVRLEDVMDRARRAATDEALRSG